MTTDTRSMDERLREIRDYAERYNPDKGFQDSGSRHRQTLLEAYDKLLADYEALRRTQSEGAIRMEGVDTISLETLRWWRQLVDANPQDLAPRLDAAIERTSLPQHAQSGVVEARIKHMVQRFLGWKLPNNFNPDGGISFDPVANKGHAFESRREPVGTNLFDAAQAETMVRYMVEGITDAPTSRVILERIRGNAVAGLECTKSARTYRDMRRYFQQVIDGIDVELALSHPPSKPAPVVDEAELREALKDLVECIILSDYGYEDFILRSIYRAQAILRSTPSMQTEKENG